MSYLTREMTIKAIRNMYDFHKDVQQLYTSYDMDLLDNLGRRNIIMSQTQEKFFADALSGELASAYMDGRTGQPDISIPELNIELECKLTSRHKSGAISFHTDFETLNQKGKLDYLYVIADENFQKFCVLHFLDLTIADFNKVANGSRGKVAMKKHQGMKKCHVLAGEVSCLNDYHIKKLKKKLENSNNPKVKRALEKKLEYWLDTPSKFSFHLEEILNCK